MLSSKKMFILVSLFFILSIIHCQKSVIIPAKQWGASSPPFTLPEHKIEFITIHHGGVIFKQHQDPIAYLKQLQEWSRKEKGWMDIPYHFLIAPDGRIFEGRDIKYPGDTNTSYDPLGHALICVLGNFEEQQPTQEQLTALAWLTAKLSLQYHVSLDRVKSHKDYTETLCPGKNLYQYLQNGQLISMIQKELNRVNK